MKKSVVFVILLLALSISSNAIAMEYSVMGVNTKWLGERNWWKMALGAATSVAVHCAGHLLYLESQEKDWRLEIPYEICEDPLTTHQKRWFSRAGFVAQVGTALILSLTVNDSDFVRGFCAAAVVESISYPIRFPVWGGAGDFAHLDRNGCNWQFEYGLYSVGSIISLTLSMDNKPKQGGEKQNEGF